ANRLGFTAKKTMTLAQRLYEGVELGDEGQTALITYMRTDSVRLSPDAVAGARAYVAQRWGKDYLPAEPVQFKTKKSAQDAHEAIRPTSRSTDRKRSSRRKRPGRRRWKGRTRRRATFLASSRRSRPGRRWS